MERNKNDIVFLFMLCFILMAQALLFLTFEYKVQCDQIGLFLKYFGDNFTWQLFWLFWKMHFSSKNWRDNLVGKLKNWASFYSNIWSHWVGSRLHLVGYYKTFLTALVQPSIFVLISKNSVSLHSIYLTLWEVLIWFKACAKLTVWGICHDGMASIPRDTY